MKPIGVLAILIVGLFAVFLGYSLVKEDKPKTAEEVKLQLQMDDNKQAHQVQLQELGLHRDLELNHQQLDYQAYLQQQTLNHDAQLQQLQMQQSIATEQWKSANQAQLEQQKYRAEADMKQLELGTQTILNKQKLTADNERQGLALQHDENMQRQASQSTERHIYVLLGAGVAIIVVVSGAFAALFRTWRRSHVELVRLNQSHNCQLEDRKALHEMRMKVLDVIVKFPQEERSEIIMKVISSTAPAPAVTVLPTQERAVLDMPPLAPELEAAVTAKPTPRQPTPPPPVQKPSDAGRLAALALMQVSDSKRLLRTQMGYAPINCV